MNIIEELVEARKAKKITQKELAKRTGINQSSISRIERGVRIPTLNVLIKLVEGIDMTLKLEPR